jgi:hypothetical protein
MQLASKRCLSMLGARMDSFQIAVGFVVVAVLTFLFVVGEMSKYGKHPPNARRRFW